MQLKIEREALKKETDAASKDRLARLEKELADLEEQSAAITAALAGREGEARLARRSSRSSSTRRATSSRRRSARATLSAAGELAYGVIPELEKKLTEAEAQDGKGAHGRGGGDARPHRRRSCRAGPAFRSTRCSKASARSCCSMEDELGKRVVGQGEAVRGRLDGGAARPRRPAGPEPADRLVHVPRPDRRRQDRADQGAGRVPVRRRDGDGAHRHVGVHGEALGRPADRRASRLCRLRGGRRADRGGAAAALPGRPVRRDREGASGRVQRAAAGARRRPPDRRPGPHGRLPQHADHHDLEPRLRVSGQPDARARTSTRCATR